LLLLKNVEAASSKLFEILPKFLAKQKFWGYAYTSKSTILSDKQEFYQAKSSRLTWIYILQF